MAKLPPLDDSELRALLAQCVEIGHLLRVEAHRAGDGTFRGLLQPLVRPFVHSDDAVAAEAEVVLQSNLGAAR